MGKKAIIAALTAALALSMPLSALAAEADKAEDAAKVETTAVSEEEYEKEEVEATKEDDVFYFVELTLDHSMISLLPGKNVPLDASAKLPSGVEADFKWESADPSVATVDATGRVFAVRTGNTVVSASIGSVKVDCRVEVTVDPIPYDGAMTAAVRTGFTTISKADDEEVEIVEAEETETKAADAEETAEATEAESTDAEAAEKK